MFHSSPLPLVTTAQQRHPCQLRRPPLPPLVRPLSCHRCPISPISPCPISLPVPSYKLNPTVLSFVAYPALASSTLLQVVAALCTTRRIASRIPALLPSPASLFFYSLPRSSPLLPTPPLIFYHRYACSLADLAALSIIPTPRTAYHRQITIRATILGLE